MYESPINRIYGEISNEIIRKDEENIMITVNQQVGYQVDKSELIKALNYDRNQYEKGLTDALDKIRAEIERQEKWLMDAGYNAYNVDIAFSSIKSALAESEEQNEIDKNS